MNIRNMRRAYKNKLTLYNMENVDLFNLFQIVLDNDRPLNETKERAIKYCDENNVSRNVIMTVASAIGTNIDYDAIKHEKGGKVMCALFDSIAKGNEEKGKVEGEAKGIVETGIEFKIPENDIMKRLQNKLNLSLQKAQEYFEMFGKQTV